MKKNFIKVLIIIAVITVCIGAKVYADYIMNATDVEYTKSDSTKVSVKTALDDLYTKSQQLNEIENLELSSLVFSLTNVELTYLESQSITITNPNSYEITVESSDSTVATVTKNSNTEVIINALSQDGVALITVNVLVGNSSIKIKEIKVGVWSGSGAMPVSVAKSVVNASNICLYQGMQVDYNPTGGGTWRIFYLDVAGKYGDGAGVLYIKRDYVANSSVSMGDSVYRTYYSSQSDSDIKSVILSDMRKI